MLGEANRDPLCFLFVYLHARKLTLPRYLDNCRPVLDCSVVEIARLDGKHVDLVAQPAAADLNDCISLVVYHGVHCPLVVHVSRATSFQQLFVVVKCDLETPFCGQWVLHRDCVAHDVGVDLHVAGESGKEERVVVFSVDTKLSSVPSDRGRQGQEA
jgi:hypothetical protein